MRVFMLSVMLALPFAAGAQTIKNVQLEDLSNGAATNRSTIRATFELAGFQPPLLVQFQRSDGAADTLSNYQNGGAVIELPLTDLGRRDSDHISWNVVVTAADGKVVRLDHAVSIFYDNSPPALPVVTSPQFPALIAGKEFTLVGTLADAQSGEAVRAGTVSVRKWDGRHAGIVIGAGGLDGTGRFAAGVTLEWMAQGESAVIAVVAADAAGNEAPVLLLDVTRSRRGFKIHAR